MKNKFNSFNDSLFSVDYKIPYSKESIQYHLEESQEQINFIKFKLTEAYQKLELQIQNNNDLELQNQDLKLKVRDLQEKYLYEKKENSKLKETLEVILKNRKLMQEESEELRENNTKKIAEKQQLVEELNKQIKALSAKCNSLTAECDQKDRIIKDCSDRLKEQSLEKEFDSQRQASFLNTIQILEQQIAKLTEEKYIQVNRLRHQLQLYQRTTSPFSKEIKIQQQERSIQRKRQFSRPANTFVAPKYQKFNTKASQSTQFDFNKENVNSLQVNPMANSLIQSSVSKWKRPPSVKESVKPEIAERELCSTAMTDDQQLTLYQMSRKKAEQELLALQKIKRPNNDQRQKIARLQREIYHLDSDIAGLKRKIRRKY